MSDKDKNKNWFARHKVLTTILGFVVIAIIASAAGGGSKSNTGTTKSDTTASISNKTEAGTQPAATETKQPAVPAEYKSALSQAGTYASTMHLSKQGVYDQLVSEYGGKFSAEAAQYAIDNVKADWNANALAQGKTYQNDMHLSPTAVHDQLTSSYGGKFTAAEADYAVAHLND
jgi:hypothetical protein